MAKRERAKLNQRQRILAAMVESAGATGYREATMREVLRRAGVSVPVFYAHFAGKQEQMTARAIAGMIASEVSEGRASRMEELLPRLVLTALAPYLGGEMAVGQPKVLGRRRLGEAERGGAGDQRAEDGVEGVVRFDAGLAGALPGE